MELMQIWVPRIYQIYPPVDPAPEEAMHEEATTDEETGAEEGGHIGWRGHRGRGNHFK